MTNRPTGRREILRWVGGGVAFLAAGLAIGLLSTSAYRVASWIASDVDERRDLFVLFWRILTSLWSSYGATVVATLTAIPVVALMRVGARARLRAGHADPLESARGFVTKHPRWAALATALPGLAWTARLAHLWWSADAAHPIAPWEAGLAAFAVPAGMALLANVLLAHKGLRALLAPTLTEDSAEDETAEGFTFEAVAVTRETVAAVAALVVVSVAMVALVTKRPTGPPTFGLIAAYTALAAGAAAAFQRASRVSIGLDGVFVGGSSRRRFFAYRDIDDVRAWSGDLELVVRGRVALRLQLHGKDGSRTHALLARLREELERARAQREDPATAFVASADASAIARAAGGASSYRTTAPSRDKLWEMFESPAIAAESRQAVGEALLHGLANDERARFRVAADRCADPAVRVRLQELIDEREELPNEEEDREAAPKAALLGPQG